VTIPLESAFLCVNCDHVGGSAIRCEHCSSEHGLLSVSAVFDLPARNLWLTDAEKEKMEKLEKEIHKVVETFQTCMVGV
jgi:hypothetical protein